ncbi:uncharacterized protein [Haliotis cracherodii]|uniref:uncharacterized protein n=1 Tax=Haliotis cracherodii TaxID=6455 RepID=UPI0039EAE167
MYDPNGMSPAGRTVFLQWHTRKGQEGALFDLQGELLAYCQSDVDILRRGCADFRQNAINSVGMDPFVEVMTAAAFTMKSFRKHDLKPNTIAILPPQGYQPKKKYSQACMHWLNYLMEMDPHLHLQHARNGGEKEFTCGEGQHRYSVDGNDPATGTIYKFLGCFWHGCQTCHKTQRGEPHTILGTSLGARYTVTTTACGSTSLRKCNRRTPLCVLSCRVPTVSTSLARSTLATPAMEDTPMPRDYATKPKKVKPSNSPCEHTDEERSWVGTYATIELQEAVKKYDYQHDPGTQQVGLFDTYIDRHFKDKLEASGYPEGCTDHDTYIQEIYGKEGIGLDKDRIENNPGRRTIAKMQLNSLWGKFGQRLDYSQNIYMNDPVQYFTLWRDERNTIKDVTVVNEQLD